MVWYCLISQGCEKHVLNVVFFSFLNHRKFFDFDEATLISIYQKGKHGPLTIEVYFFQSVRISNLESPWSINYICISQYLFTVVMSGFIFDHSHIAESLFTI